MDCKIDAICVGSVLWDVIGRTNQSIRRGDDIGGFIKRIPGGVAFNIAQNLVNLEINACLLGFLGNDNAGIQLASYCQNLGINTDYIYRSDKFTTDNYLAIEDNEGVVAAIADAHSLESVGYEILKPLKNKQFNSSLKTNRLPLIVDGNLKSDLLNNLAADSFYEKFDLKLVPASPGKASRLTPFITKGNVTLYLNLSEAQILCGINFSDTVSAAIELISYGVGKVIITNGQNKVSMASKATGVLSVTPPKIKVKRLTGAGDAFLAAHVKAEMLKYDPEKCLEFAVEKSAMYISE
jgi:sugar/nucleoside kinase (ribokinase family)|tara:strand:+ start:2921 stop:3805 length:885 start_codon:yes stop_codon:yes gene_type:complete